MRLNVKHKNTDVTFIDLTYSDVLKRKDFCPICSNLIKNKDKVYLVINNFQLFPNILIHKCCCDEEHLEGVVMILESLYKTAEKYKKEYGMWWI